MSGNDLRFEAHADSLDHFLTDLETADKYIRKLNQHLAKAFTEEVGFVLAESMQKYVQLIIGSQNMSSPLFLNIMLKVVSRPSGQLFKVHRGGLGESSYCSTAHSDGSQNEEAVHD